MKKKGKIIIFVLFILINGNGCNFFNKKITTTPILKTTQDEAERWCIDNQINCYFEDEYSEEIEKGLVISTSSKKDKIQKGTSLTIFVSLGTRKIEIIDYKDYNKEKMKTWCQENNINYRLETEYSDTIKKDNIINLNKEPGTIHQKDDLLIITVSLGKETIVFPNFMKYPKETIEKWCQKYKFNCTFKTEYSFSIKNNYLIELPIEKGTKLELDNREIVFNLSKGPNKNSKKYLATNKMSEYLKRVGEFTCNDNICSGTLKDDVNNTSQNYIFNFNLNTIEIKVTILDNQKRVTYFLDYKLETLSIINTSTNTPIFVYDYKNKKILKTSEEVIPVIEEFEQKALLLQKVCYNFFDLAKVNVNDLNGNND